MPPTRTTSTSAAAASTEMYTKDDCVFFWRTSHANGWASQWYPAPFTARLQLAENGQEEGDKGEMVQFPTAEHWMMAQKAILFNDRAIARQVLGIKGTSRSEMQHVKALGRKVKRFDEKVWVRERERIVLEGSLLKFRQNAELKEKLLGTGEKMIAEASPRDKIWGIGMGEAKAVSKGGRKWGLNLLGKALVETRRMLRDEPEAVDEAA